MAGWRVRSFDVLVFDHRRLAYFVQIFFRLGFEALDEYLLAHLALERRFRRAFFLVADGEHLQALRGYLRRSKTPDLNVAEQIPQLRSKVGRIFGDWIAHRDIAQSARHGQAVIAGEEPAAQAFCLAALR